MRGVTLITPLRRYAAVDDERMMLMRVMRGDAIQSAARALCCDDARRRFCHVLLLVIIMSL